MLLYARNVNDNIHSTNTHLPASPWSTVAPVTIPLSSCNNAADMLIEWFGKEELTYVVGGERWWQVRGLDGVDAEWVADSEQIDTVMALPTDMPEIEKDILRMECLESVLVCALIVSYDMTKLIIKSSTFMEVCFARFIERITRLTQRPGGYSWGSISRFFLVLRFVTY